MKIRLESNYKTIILLIEKYVNKERENVIAQHFASKGYE